MQFTMVAGWVLFGFTALLAVPGIFDFPRRRLRRFAARYPDPPAWPRVSVIIAAKDEEACVEAALRGLLASDYPDLQIVFANDRSTDRTGAIADSLAREDSRLSVLHIDTLPAGWLGKCHALARAAERATGEYLVFTDGDVLFEPDTIRLVMRYVVARPLAHFCLLPNVLTGSYLERAIVTLFGMLFLFSLQPWFRAMRLPHAYYGIGAFNLVLRTAYERVGGHEPIRLDVLDDVKLGKLLYRHGYSADYLCAGTALQVKWQDSAWGVVRGLEKNAFASLGYSIPMLLVFTLVSTALNFVPYAGLLVWPDPASHGLLATLLLTHTTYALLGSCFGAGASVVFAYPLASAAVLLAYWRSAVLTLKRGGVRWRETVYPLSELRRHLY